MVVFFMINYNGTIYNDENFISIKNRGLNYGDALFETINFQNGRVLYCEDHYFRLMASMRMLRMEIPMNFTMEFFIQEIQKIAGEESCRIKLLVWRKEGGKYLPDSREIEYAITKENLAVDKYVLDTSDNEIELFKDFSVNSGLLSSLKTTNKIVHVSGSIFAEENDYDNCLLLNEKKNVVEALNSNIFLVFKDVIVTPPISEGCLNGVMRKNILKLLQNSKDFKVEERAVSPFELQRADEIFLTNVIQGIRPVSKYRKKSFRSEVASKLIDQINTLNALSIAAS